MFLIFSLAIFPAEVFVMKSHMIGDNKSFINSSMQLHAKLHNCHTMLSFHRVRETIAAGMSKVK
jgi:hypothetical protein